MSVASGRSLHARYDQKSATALERMPNARTIFRDGLAHFVGPGRYVRVEQAAADSGIGADTIRRYLRGESCPEWVNGLALLHILPPDFAAAVLRPADLAGFYRIGGTCAAGEALRELTEGAAALARALADLRIDHTEAPIVRQALTEAAIAIAQFLGGVQ